MIRFVCDYCGNVKQSNETWVNGVAAENVGTQAARREVIIDPAWRYERAILPFGVHFCSLDCKDSYLEKLFDKPVSLLEVQRVALETERKRRVVRVKKLPAPETGRKRTTKSTRSRGR